MSLLGKRVRASGELSDVSTSLILDTSDVTAGKLLDTDSNKKVKSNTLSVLGSQLTAVGGTISIFGDNGAGVYAGGNPVLVNNNVNTTLNAIGGNITVSATGNVTQNCGSSKVLIASVNNVAKESIGPSYSTYTNDNVSVIGTTSYTLGAGNGSTFCGVSGSTSSTGLYAPTSTGAYVNLNSGYSRMYHGTEAGIAIGAASKYKATSTTNTNTNVTIVDDASSEIDWKIGGNNQIQMTATALNVTPTGSLSLQKQTEVKSDTDVLMKINRPNENYLRNVIEFNYNSAQKWWIGANAAGLNNSTSGDYNFGIHDAGAGKCRIQISSTGCVGIGASLAPITDAIMTAGLTIAGPNSTDQGLLHLRSPGAESQYITFTEHGVADKASIGCDAGNASLMFKTGYPSSSSRMTIVGSKVGIGNNNPPEVLTVHGGIMMDLDNSSLGFNQYYNAGYKNVNTGYSAEIYLGSSGDGLRFSTTATSSAAGSTITPVSRVTITANGTVNLGGDNTDLATSMQKGYMVIRCMNGAPSQIPNDHAHGIPLVYDYANHKLWAYDSGWKSVTFA